MKRCWMLIVCGALLWGGFVPETAALEVPGETIGEKSAETEKKAEPVKEEQPSEIDRILSGEEAKKHVRFASMELPKSFVLYRDRRTGKVKICFSQLSTASLAGRAREK